MASSSWAERNARAQAKGYRNYYDYRLHQYGTRPPSEPVPPGQELLRGHRGPSAFRKQIALHRMDHRIYEVREFPDRRRADGTWASVHYVVTFKDGRIIRYSIPLARTGHPERKGRKPRAAAPAAAPGGGGEEGPSYPDLTGELSELEGEDEAWYWWDWDLDDWHEMFDDYEIDFVPYGSASE